MDEYGWFCDDCDERFCSHCEKATEVECGKYVCSRCVDKYEVNKE